MDGSTLPLSTSFVFEPITPTHTTTPSAPPLDLTASDGTGLELVSLTARVVVEDPLAFTELHLVFQNPEHRQLEGRFRVALPSGASISRFAMRIAGHWQEGEVVERQAARRAYEDFLHRRQDPALLEHEAGNEFSARVFPIEARERKELIVSYSHELPAAGSSYRLPLSGLPRLGDLDIRALVGRSGGSGTVSSLGGSTTRWEVLEVRKQAWKPDRDFEVKPPESRRDGLRHGNLAVVRVAPKLPELPEEVGSLLLLIDTSASRALGHKRQLELIEHLITGLAKGAGPETPVAVACFDQAVDLVYEGAASSFGPEVIRRIDARLALGASDLERALRWPASRAEGPRYERLILLTDGVATAGETASDKLVEAVRALSGAGIQRLDVIAVGGIRDDATLRCLVTAGLPKDGTVSDGDLPLTDLAAKLTRSTRSGIKVEVPGSSWVWPARLDGVQPGDSALIYVDIPEQRELKVHLDGKPVAEAALVLEPAERPLLERAWVKARIDKLEDQRARIDGDADLREGLRKQVIDLSTKHRVLSPYTALLVLETEADYARFNIDRRALADILTVGAGGLEVLHRAGGTPAQVAPPVFKPPLPPTSTPTAKSDVERARAPQLEEEIGESADEFEAGETAAEITGSQFGADLRNVFGGAPQAQMDSAPIPVADSPPSRPGPSIDAFVADPVPPPPSPSAYRTESAPAPPSPGRRSVAAEPMSASPVSVSRSEKARRARPSLLQRVTEVASRLFSSSDDGERSQEPEERRVGAQAGRIGGTEATSAPPRTPQPPAETPVAPPSSSTPPITNDNPGVVPPPLGTPRTDAWDGPFAEVMALVLSGRGHAALDRALTWRISAPGDVLALVALGMAAETAGDAALAARAYGSLIDLFPSRADLRRFAGELLERIAADAGLEVAIDTYRKAVEQRPDHPASHRLLGMALLKAGRFAEAFDAIADGQGRPYPPRFPGVDRILAEDLGLAAAAWIAAEPERRGAVLERLNRAGTKLEDGPSLRFVLVWETDANDVDFHIHDAQGGHAYYSSKVLPSGGELYADVTQGYGPECFTIRLDPKRRAYPYRLQAHYFRRGPMGYGMGKLQIIEHDGRGRFAFEERPYVVMQDGAYLELGHVLTPLEVR